MNFVNPMISTYSDTVHCYNFCDVRCKTTLYFLKLICRYQMINDPAKKKILHSVLKIFFIAENWYTLLRKVCNCTTGLIIRYVICSLKVNLMLCNMIVCVKAI